MASINLGRFQSSEKFESIEKHPEVEIIPNPPEWKYVEQLLSKKLIPEPTPKVEYPSGWKPQDPEKYKELPYFVSRTRNHMMPVYLKIGHRGLRRRTYIRNIEGDIWQAEKDFVQVIQKRIGQCPVYTQINEMNRQIIIRGDYVTLIQKYLYSRGL